MEHINNSWNIHPGASADTDTAAKDNDESKHAAVGDWRVKKRLSIQR